MNYLIFILVLQQVFSNDIFVCESPCVALESLQELDFNSGSVSQYSDGNVSPQIQCIDGDICDDILKVNEVVCFNNGLTERGEVDWSCEVDMPENLMVTAVYPLCEGYRNENDRNYAYVNSCVAKVSVMKMPSELPLLGDDGDDIIFYLIVICWLFCCAYSCGVMRRQRESNTGYYADNTYSSERPYNEQMFYSQPYYQQPNQTNVTVIEDRHGYGYSQPENITVIEEHERVRQNNFTYNNAAAGAYYGGQAAGTFFSPSAPPPPPNVQHHKPPGQSDGMHHATGSSSNARHSGGLFSDWFSGDSSSSSTNYGSSSTPSNVQHHSAPSYSSGMHTATSSSSGSHHHRR
jgi:hypothetical protein